MEAPGHAVGGLCAGLATGVIASWHPLATLGAGMVGVVTSGSICGPDMDQRAFWKRLRSRVRSRPRLHRWMDHRRGTHSVWTALGMTVAWLGLYLARQGSARGVLAVLAVTVAVWLVADRAGARVSRDASLAVGLVTVSTLVPWIGLGLLAGWWSHLVLDFAVGRAHVAGGTVLRGRGIPFGATCHHHGLGRANGGLTEIVWTWLVGPGLSVWLCLRGGQPLLVAPAALAVVGAVVPRWRWKRLASRKRSRQVAVQRQVVDVTDGVVSVQGGS